MDPASLSKGHPVFRIMILHAFSRGERLALSRMSEYLPIMGADEKIPSERTRTMEEVKAAVLNLWAPVLNMRHNYKLGWFLNGIEGGLIAAARVNNTAAMRLAQANRATNFGQAMAIAAGRDNLAALQLATEARAVQFRTEILSSREYDTRQVVSKEEGIMDSAMLAAARNGHVGAMEVISEGLDWSFSHSALEAAASRGQIAAMKLAIQRGAGSDGGLNDAFIEAAKAGQLGAMQYLEESGADENQLAINTAAKVGQRRTIRWLVERKNLVDLNEALYFAAAGNHEKTMRLLVENGATHLFAPGGYDPPNQWMKELLTKVLARHLKASRETKSWFGEIIAGA